MKFHPNPFHIKKVGKPDIFNHVLVPWGKLIIYNKFHTNQSLVSAVLLLTDRHTHTLTDPSPFSLLCTYMPYYRQGSL